jgi:hypothetical protein
MWWVCSYWQVVGGGNALYGNRVSQVTGLSLMTPPLLELIPGNSVSKKRSYSGCRGGSSGSSLLTDPPRKQRRYWSPQLHRFFSEAVRQLGGEQG